MMLGAPQASNGISVQASAFVGQHVAEINSRVGANNTMSSLSPPKLLLEPTTSLPFVETLMENITQSLFSSPSMVELPLSLRPAKEITLI
jgi:hypothetical protein